MHPDAFLRIPGVTERRGSTCSDPLISAVVLFLLFSQPLLHQTSDFFYILFSPLRVCLFPVKGRLRHRLRQPALQRLRQTVLFLNIFKILQKRLVEPVIVRFFFYQDRPCHMVKFRQAGLIQI